MSSGLIYELKDSVLSVILFFCPLILGFLLSLVCFWTFSLFNIYIFYAQNFVRIDSLSIFSYLDSFSNFVFLSFVGFLSSPLVLFVYFKLEATFFMFCIILAYFLILIALVFRKNKFGHLIFSLPICIFYFLGYELMAV